MLTAETETYYAAFNPASSGPLSVYVDGSFLVRGEQKTRRVPVGSGWAIEDADGKLAGYGVSVFKARYTSSSEHHELRSMVSFLDAMHESFPDFITSERKIILICDNASIVRALSSSYKVEPESRRLAERYGNDFVRILCYMSTLNLGFEWVKGHAENKFNQMADRLARTGYRSMVNRGFFNGEGRRKCVKNAVHVFKTGKMTETQMKSMIARDGMDALQELPTIFVDAYHIQQEGRIVAGLSFSDGDGSLTGVRGGVFRKDNEDVLFLSLRAVNYALKQVIKAGKQHETLIIRVKHHETAELINFFAKGSKLPRRRKNAKVAAEVDILRSLLAKQYTLAIATREFARICPSYNSNYGMSRAIGLSRNLVSQMVAESQSIAA